MTKTRQSGQSTFTFRIDPTLKKEFETEARRQSSLIAASPEEERVMDWIKDVADGKAWQ